ncbi:non-hydrolyzing UDP-N-acetylglucosamine 2-epimerase [Salinibacter ruber]|uniref:non-hydrolyzing UDP-N-acetylglucosamine 2-epimerase n=1 Tax=Salinibacter ruber TaxID=146919 RepID=UPI00216A986A|nr:UDP-N-acetylglucosamine 2-epimerase (non-hydrolyzing) [Salinibacter ruber]MCS4223602.1 UDP-N-acetylglucosamine 2-epimerase (non-hydrolyzing) [Salinibacter ruber]
MHKVLLVFGTRPEATKMAPVYRALKSMPEVKPLVLLTGQHREQLQDALELFNISAIGNLDLMEERQTMPGVASRMLPQLASRFREVDPSFVLAHGDTLTTFVVAWVSFMEGIPVGHVEAGLRSHDLEDPFPEEANRKLTDVLTSLELAPTVGARRNLLEEGKDPDNIVVTGQTAVDAVRIASRSGELPDSFPQPPYITVTLHRRENWPRLEEIAEALAEVARMHREYTFVYPVHLNPVVREAVTPVLQSVSNFMLTDPLEYGTMASLLDQSSMVITDSGGLQEEGASLGVPVLVCREVTERPEGLETGILRLAGTEKKQVMRNAKEALEDPSFLNQDSAMNPYGDGRAGERVAQAVAWKLGVTEKPEDWQTQCLSDQ